MINTDIWYFIYARKSTDEADRQVLSIGSQLAELREYARREGLDVAREFVESKTAKEPGREVFNDMLTRMERGAARGIIAWHPDRLARNSIDGGRVIYLSDTGVVQALKFPTFWFDLTPQGKFMLSIAFGQSKYYIDNLSENVKRGIRQKLRDGVWPSCAPFGYRNDVKNHTIRVDSLRAPFVRKAFELYATGDRPVKEVRDYLRAAGVLGRRGKNPLSSSQCHVMLRNPIYYGVMRHKGELYEGRHAPLIAKALFDRCQEMFKNKSKPRSTGLKPFVYRGAFRCAACGCFITTETQKGHNYLHCTKKKGSCSEHFVREEEMDRLVRKALARITLPPALVDQALANIKTEGAKAARAGTEAARELRAELAALNGRSDKLVDLLLHGAIAQPEYARKQARLVNDKKELEGRLEAFVLRGGERFEPLRRFYEFCATAGEAVISGVPADNLRLLKRAGTGFVMGGRRLKFDHNAPLKKLLELRGGAEPAAVDWRRFQEEMLVYFASHPEEAF